MKDRKRVGTHKETAAYQRLYESLLAVCDEHGTMVMQDRVLERDKDIAPHRFYRKGTREYVFPPQNATPSISASHFIDPNPNYELRAQIETFNVDESLVKGKLHIEYNDAGDHPELFVKDMRDNSELPDEVRKTLDDIF